MRRNVSEPHGVTSQHYQAMKEASHITDNIRSGLRAKTTYSVPVLQFTAYKCAVNIP